MMIFWLQLMLIPFFMARLELFLKSVAKEKEEKNKFVNFNTIDQDKFKNLIIKNKEICKKYNIPEPELFISNELGNQASAYQSVSGKENYISFSIDLVENFSFNELLTVLLHELNHIKDKHHKKTFNLYLLLQVLEAESLILFSYWMLNSNMIKNNFWISLSTMVTFYFINVIMFSNLTGIARNFIGRNFEFDSDIFSVKENGIENFKETALKLAFDDMQRKQFWLKKEGLLQILFPSHPSWSERIKNVDSLKISK